MNPDPCLVCGGELQPSSLPGLYRCRLCGFVTAGLAPAWDELQKLYGETYFRGEEYRDYLAERPTIEKQSRFRLRTLLRYVDQPARKYLLEIGAAYGFFLALARDVFAGVEGTEVSQEASRYAAEVLGLNVRCIDLLDDHPGAIPDVVCMWDTIEHLVRPDLYLQRMSQVMGSGGVLAITTGDIGSAVARFRGTRWRLIHVPTHLHYFSQQTLTRLLARYGFSVRYCGREGVYRRMRTIAYLILCRRHSWSGLYHQVERLLDWDLYLNLRDIMFVIATKD